MSITYCLFIYPLPDFSNVVLLWGKFVFVFPDNDMADVELFFGCYELELIYSKFIRSLP